MVLYLISDCIGFKNHIANVLPPPLLQIRINVDKASKRFTATFLLAMGRQPSALKPFDVKDEFLERCIWRPKAPLKTKEGRILV